MKRVFLATILLFLFLFGGRTAWAACTTKLGTLPDSAQPGDTVPWSASCAYQGSAFKLNLGQQVLDGGWFPSDGTYSSSFVMPDLGSQSKTVYVALTVNDPDQTHYSLRRMQYDSGATPEPSPSPSPSEPEPSPSPSPEPPPSPQPTKEPSPAPTRSPDPPPSPEPQPPPPQAPPPQQPSGGQPAPGNPPVLQPDSAYPYEVSAGAQPAPAGSANGSSGPAESLPVPTTDPGAAAAPQPQVPSSGTPAAPPLSAPPPTTPRLNTIALPPSNDHNPPFALIGGLAGVGFVIVFAIWRTVNE